MKKLLLAGVFLSWFVGPSVLESSPQLARLPFSTQKVRYLYTCSFDQNTRNYYWSDAFSTSETDTAKISEAWDDFIEQKYHYKNKFPRHCYGEAQKSLEAAQWWEHSQIERISSMNPTWNFIETAWHYPGTNASGPPSLPIPPR